MKTSFVVALLSVALFAGCSPEDGTHAQLGGPVPRGSAFAWTYSPRTEGEIPRTVIGLDITDPDGTVHAVAVDEVEGGCNDYPEPDADAYGRSTMILCYYAGLGRYYKIVEVDDGYEVRRRTFEEATPDHDPPVTPFETIAVF